MRLAPILPYITLSSQMPCHLISDMHEWINEIPTVPIYYLVKPQQREWALQKQQGKETLLAVTNCSQDPITGIFSVVYV